MNTKRFVTIIILVLGLLLTLSVGLSAAREAQDDPPPADPASVSAAVSYMIPVQGRLTNASGSPLNGDYNLTLRVYDDVTGGNLKCLDSHLVSVNNGLFNTEIYGCSPSDINGEQLYLGIEVEGDGEMMPRQPLYPVPYAFSLVPGASLTGEVDTGSMLTVKNESSEYGNAIYGYSTAQSGGGFGVVGRSNSPQGYGGYFTNPSSDGVALRADGTGIVQSSAKTYLFVPGSNIIKNNSRTTTEWQMQFEGSSAKIAKGSSGPGPGYVRIPITIPAVLYGQPVRVTQIKVYYKCPSTPGNYIYATSFTKNTDADSKVPLISNSDRELDRTSTVADDYIIDTISPANLLSADDGFLTLGLDLNFSDDNQEIWIGGVRLTLEHD